MRLQVLAPAGRADRARPCDGTADGMRRTVDQVEKQRQRGEKFVVLRQMLLDQGVALVAYSPVVKFNGPFDEGLLSIIRESESGKLVVLSGRGRSPCHRVKIHEPRDCFVSPLSCVGVRGLVPPFPLSMVGVNQHLEALEHPIVVERPSRHFEIRDELVRLDATEKRKTEIRNVDMPTSDAVSVEGLVTIVSFEKEGAVAFSPFPFPRGHEPNEFVPDI